MWIETSRREGEKNYGQITDIFGQINECHMDNYKGKMGTILGAI